MAKGQPFKKVEEYEPTPEQFKKRLGFILESRKQGVCSVLEVEFDAEGKPVSKKDLFPEEMVSINVEKINAHLRVMMLRGQL